MPSRSSSAAARVGSESETPGPLVPKREKDLRAVSAPLTETTPEEWQVIDSPPSTPKPTTSVTRPTVKLSRTVFGPFPPLASSKGKAWYVLRRHHTRGIAVVAGWPKALQVLGGSWTGQGRAPEGFDDINSALNAAHLLKVENKDKSDTIEIIYDHDQAC